MLHGRLDARRGPSIRIAGQRIRHCLAVKYLGVQVSAGLKFGGHLKELTNKLMTVIAPLRRVLKKDWGLKRKATQIWLNGLMKPVALYASPVWYETAITSTGRRRMDRAQRMGLLACLRVCRTVSTHAMQVLAGTTPWDLEALRMALRYKCKRGLLLTPVDPLTEEEARDDDALALVERKVGEMWQQRWTNSTSGRVTHAYILSVGRVPGLFDPPTRTLFLLTGHGSLNAFLFKIAQCHTTECLCGWRYEDW